MLSNVVKIKFSSILVIVICLNNVLNALMDYTEKGWPEICSKGIGQSPIDLPPKESCSNLTDYIRIKSSNYNIIKNVTLTLLHDYKFWFKIETDYRRSTEIYDVLELVKNKISYAYELKYIQIHSPSDHKSNGEAYDVELQLVHEKNIHWMSINGITNDPDFKNNILIISIMFQADQTASNNTNINLDLNKMNFGSYAKNTTSLDLNPYVKSSGAFFHYEGSLTNVECDETVNWIIMEKIEAMSTNQLKEIKNWIGKTYPQGNSRSIKQINGRKIYYHPKNNEIYITLFYIVNLICVLILTI
jgi:carbonic anhydrase